MGGGRDPTGTNQTRERPRGTRAEAISGEMDRLCDPHLDGCLQHGENGGFGRVYREAGSRGTGQVRRGGMSWFTPWCCLRPAASGVLCCFLAFSVIWRFRAFPGVFWLFPENTRLWPNWEGSHVRVTWRRPR